LLLERVEKVHGLERLLGGEPIEGRGIDKGLGATALELGENNHPNKA
jgi:hypothetical protein